MWSSQDPCGIRMTAPISFSSLETSYLAASEGKCKMQNIIRLLLVIFFCHLPYVALCKSKHISLTICSVFFSPSLLNRVCFSPTFSILTPAVMGFCLQSKTGYKLCWMNWKVYLVYNSLYSQKAAFQSVTLPTFVKQLIHL